MARRGRTGSRLEALGWRIPCSLQPMAYGLSRGFTLLELLVAMVLMVAVASSLYTALYTGFRAHRSALLAVEPTSQALNAIELLKEDILGVLPPDSNGLAGAFVAKNATGLKGMDDDSVEFYTTHVYADDKNPNGGVGKVGLLLEEDTETNHSNYTTYRLIRQITTNLLARKEVKPQEQVLCRDVTSLNLRYFDGTDWVNDWDSTEDSNSLPRAVEIEIEVAYFARDGKIIKSNTREPETRRLIQSFVVPCQAAEATTETSTSGSSSGGSTSGGSTSGGSTSGGATSGGATSGGGAR
jgi:type II secretion system protein J